MDPDESQKPNRRRRKDRRSTFLLRSQAVGASARLRDIDLVIIRNAFDCTIWRAADAAVYFLTPPREDDGEFLARFGALHASSSHGMVLINDVTLE